METLQSNNSAELQSPDDVQDWETQMNDLIAKNNYGYYRSRSEIHYGPPPDWNRQIPNHSMEVFVGALPRDVNIFELIELIENELGENSIYELSVMMDLTHNFNASKTTRNRGFAFVTFQSKEKAQKCREALDNQEVRPGKRIRINQSTPNLHLFVANVPSNKSREEILRDLREYTDGLKDVIIFAAKTGSGEMDTKRHRGFIFLEYDTHSFAANARKKLSKPGFRLWNRELKVDWAAKKQEPSPEVMSKVKSIYIRNLTADCTDQNLKDHFSQYGEIESIKKVRDFAFIHFKDRKAAVEALQATNKTVLPENISNGTIDVELVKPNINYQYKNAMLSSSSSAVAAAAAALGFPFTNLMAAAVAASNSSGGPPPPPPFLPYPPPYGLPLPPPPHHHSHNANHHMLPPPPPPPPPHHLMYGSTNSGYHFPPFSTKNKSWNYINGSKYNYPHFNSYNRQSKMNAMMNKNEMDSGFVNGNCNNPNNGNTNGKWKDKSTNSVTNNQHSQQQHNHNHQHHNSQSNSFNSNSYERHNVGASGDNSNHSPTSRPDNVPNFFDVNKRIKSFKPSNCKNPQALFYWGMTNNDFMYRDSPFMGW